MIPACDPSCLDVGKLCAHCWPGLEPEERKRGGTGGLRQGFLPLPPIAFARPGHRMPQLWPESFERRLIYGREAPDYRARTTPLKEVPRAACFWRLCP